MNKRTRNSIKFFLNYKSYFLIFTIFIIAFIYGRNFEINSDKEPYQIKKEQLRRQLEGTHELREGTNELKINSIINTAPNIGYRLFLDLSAKLANPPSDNSAEELTIEILLCNDLGEEKHLKTLDLANGQEKTNIENVFYSDNYYRYLKIQKNDTKNIWSVTIKNVSLFALDVQNQSQISLLAPSFLGATNFNDVVLSNEEDKTNIEFVFSREQQKFGQIFAANTEIISTVELKMDFIGTGGLGNYQAEIYHYDPNTRVTEDRLAYYNFDKEYAFNELASKTKEGFYNIPLAANLLKGEQYVFFISNKMVTFNLANTLKIYGYKKQFGGNNMLFSINKKVSKKPNSLCFNIFGVKYTESQNEKILTNAVVQDLGNGKGRYTYKQRGAFSDFLDIYETSEQSAEETSVFYDNILRGVSAKNQNGIFFTYKFDTIYPFNKVSVSVEQPDRDFIDFADSLVYYSFDNKSWQKIDEKKKHNNQGENIVKLEKTILGDGKQKKLYIKFVCDEESKKEINGVTVAAKLFGIKNIILTADLTIK